MNVHQSSMCVAVVVKLSENKKKLLELHHLYLFIANLLKHLRSCQITGYLFKTSVKRQLFKLVITFSLRALQSKLVSE